MYPKVKVREEVEPVAAAEEVRSALGLKAFESLSLDNPSGPDNSPQSLPRIPESYVPNMPKLSVAVKKGNKSKDFIRNRSPPSLLKEKNNKSEHDDDNPSNIRASSVPRPRAVLSSPDNDGVIGSRNRLARAKQTTLKTGGLSQKTLALGQTGKPRSRKMESPMSTGRVLTDADNKNYKTKPTSTERTMRDAENKSKFVQHLAEPTAAKPKAGRRAKPRPSGA
ncbi:uncharacterized protein [Aristolochia californica]|uniref:uncharacterized protein isoform X2 n=1 Tax=Aristolochia californica TaxID=171875 RepID=UPI0035D7703B